MIPGDNTSSFLVYSPTNTICLCTSDSCWLIRALALWGAEVNLILHPHVKPGAGRLEEAGGSTHLSATLPRIAVLLAVTRCIVGHSILGQTLCAKHLVLLKRRNTNILFQNKSVAS